MNDAMSSPDDQQDGCPAVPQASPETERWSFEERLKYTLVPSGLYVRYRAEQRRSTGADAGADAYLFNFIFLSEG